MESPQKVRGKKRKSAGPDDDTGPDGDSRPDDDSDHADDFKISDVMSDNSDVSSEVDFAMLPEDLTELDLSGPPLRPIGENGSLERPRPDHKIGQGKLSAQPTHKRRKVDQENEQVTYDPICGLCHLLHEDGQCYMTRKPDNLLRSVRPF